MGKIFSCKICGEKISKSAKLHLQSHNLNVEEYSFLFGNNENSFYQCGFSIEHPHQYRCILNSILGENLCILHMKDVKKDVNLFEKTLNTFIKLNQNLKSEYHLEGIICPHSINFSTYRFYNALFLIECIFYGSVSFQNVFQENADFRNSKFYEDVDFGKSDFLKVANFNKCEFYKDVKFNTTKFYDYSYFWDTKFTGNASFRYAKFFGPVQFGDYVHPNLPNEIHFIATKFDNPKQTLFSGINFSNTLLRWTDLTDIKFENVKWPRTSKIKGSRFFLYDETFISNLSKNIERYTKKDYYKFTER